MKNNSQLFPKIDLSWQISCTFAALKPLDLIHKPVFRSSKKKIDSINDNTPPRLTSVAHLGGFSFYMGL